MELSAARIKSTLAFSKKPGWNASLLSRVSGSVGMNVVATTYVTASTDVDIGDIYVHFIAGGGGGGGGGSEASFVSQRNGSNLNPHPHPHASSKEKSTYAATHRRSILKALRGRPRFKSWRRRGSLKSSHHLCPYSSPLAPPHGPV